MRSAIAMTQELLDMPAAARELVEGLGEFAYGKESLGVLFCDSELDNHASLLTELRRLLPFELIGCTTVATLNALEGISEMSMTLLVLSADDVSFRVTVSERISSETVEAAVGRAYEEAAAGEKPVLLLCYPPYNLDIMLDIYPRLLSELSGDVPVFGGYPGHNSPYGVNGVFYNEEIHSDRMLLVSVRGNARPLFSVGIELSHVALEQHLVTRSQGNTIYEVDGERFTEYLNNIGMDAERLARDDTDILFVANPMLLTLPDRPAEEYRLIRTLHRLDLLQGYGVAIGDLPQGHNITIGALTRKDISNSAESGVANLLRQIEEAERADPSYRYSAILASSCVGRYMVMTPRTELEGRVFRDMTPEHLHFAGYYGYGELGPTFYQDGKATNTAQNESLTLVAL